jgi:hypothetical protein
MFLDESRHRDALPGADDDSELSPPALEHLRLRIVSSMDGLPRKKSPAVVTSKPIRLARDCVPERALLRAEEVDLFALS